MRSVLDNKSRIENENFLLKKEIQRIRDQNQLLSAKLDGKKLPVTAASIQASTNYNNQSMEISTSYSRNLSPLPSSGFKLNVKPVPGG